MNEKCSKQEMNDRFDDIKFKLKESDEIFEREQNYNAK